MSNIEPVVPNLLDATTAFTNKYTREGTPYQGAAAAQLIASLNALPAPQTLRPAATSNTIAPLARYDQIRAARGLSPLTIKQSAAALRTLATGQPATPPRRQGWFRSTISDLRSLVGSIPKLPGGILRELQALPKLPENIQAAIAESSNPIEAIGNIAAQPGVRLAPGAFVAEQLASSHGQGVQGLLAHPLFTALDVLPLASGAARTLPVTKAARAQTLVANEAEVARVVAAGRAPGTATIARPPRPLQTALTRKLDEGGQVVPNILGRGLAEVTDAFYSTTGGRAFQATFKERDLPRLESRYTTTLRQMADPTIPRAKLPESINGQSITPLLDLRDRVIEVNRHAQDAGITEARSAELYELASNPRLPDGTSVRAEQLPGLTPQERAVLAEIRDLQVERARLTEGDLTQTVIIDGTPEVFDLPTARRLSSIQNQTTKAREFNEARRAVLEPGTLTRDEIMAKLDDVNARREAGTLTRGQADDLARTWMAALDEAGWEWRGPNGTRLDPTDSDAAWREATLQQVARPQLPDVIAALRPYSRTQPVIARLIENINQGHWSSARKDLDNLSRRTVHQLPIDIDGFKAEMSRLIARDRTLRRSSQFTDKYLERITRLQQKAERRAVPARFTPAVQSAADEAITKLVEERYATSPDLPEMVNLARNRIYDPISELSDREVRILQREARDSWQAMRDAGLDPIFFSRVTPTQRARLPHVRVSDTPVTPAAAKARMWDATPYQRDIGVALTSDAMQLLQRRATEAFLDEFSTSYGRSRADLATELLPRAQARHAANPDLSLQQHLDNIMRERWVPWDRSKYSSRKSTAAFAIEGREQLWVPRVMDENMHRLFSPPLPKLTAAMDPIMSIFRTGVLALAPRWHIYNAIGGATMTAIENPSAFRYLPEVIREMWDTRSAFGGKGTGAAAPHFDGAPPAGFGTLSPEVRAWDATIRANSPLRDRLAAAHNYAVGRTLNRWFNEARNGRIAKIRDVGRRGVEMSYHANQMVDDMYRSAIGISAKKRALKAGMSDDLAEAVAVSTIRRVFQAWDEMTPMERSVMRAVVPFYGWTAHILRYAMKYPFDHPFRVAVLGSFARAELADSLSGLPDHIRDMILIGDVRANGVVKAINVGPFNPFRDLPSQFTVAGFLGNLNPVLTGVLESVGVNTMTGGPNLYPETRYDPETGRLVADPSGNLISNIVGNISPQTNLLTALIGRNEQFNQTLQRDPAAAGRQLLSNMGIPVFFRDIDIGEQLIRAEMARYEDQENARKEALTTGNLDMLRDFPGLAAYGEQIRQLNASGVLDQLRPASGQPGTPSRASRAYAIQAALTGSRDQ